jgi:hypothetical protein
MNFIITSDKVYLSEVIFLTEKYYFRSVRNRKVNKRRLIDLLGS